MRKNIIVLPVSILFVVLAANIYLFGCAKKEQSTTEMPIVELGEPNIQVMSPEVGTKTDTSVPQPLMGMRPADLSPSSTLIIKDFIDKKNTQIKLKKLGYYEGEIDSKIGPKTKAAIEQLQKALNLKEDGSVGSATNWALFGKDIQTALKNAGFYTGEIDGKIGSKTKAVIEKFQKAKGLKVDGKIGAETWRELRIYLNPSAEPQENRGK